MSFHHAYNFVPAPPRKSGVLGDGSPVGQERLHPERYHGSLEVVLTVVTPLVVGETRRKRPNKHTEVHIRSRRALRNGAVGGADVDIPVSAVKGLLRSAFEAVTNSRMGVFDGHDQPLPFRSAPHEALGVVPVRVTRDADGWFATPMLGVHRTVQAMPNPMYAAAVPDDRHHWAHFTPHGLDTLQTVPHGARVQATLRRVEHHGPSYEYYLVSHVNGVECVQRADHERHTWTADTQEVDGWICRTNAEPGTPIIRGKHDERLFFNLHDQPRLDISDTVRRDYAAVMRSYVAQRSAPQHAAHAARAVALACAAHDEAERDALCELHDGDLVYASIRDGQIERLSSVMIGRRRYGDPPARLLDHTIHPAQELGQFSRADRVFGQVVPRTVSGSRDDVAYRGHLTISPVEPVNADLKFRPGGWRMAELSTPKPTAARFYVAEDRSGAPLQHDGQAFKSTLYQHESGQGLRGRKVYPHHRDAASNPEFPPAAAPPGVPETERNATALAYLAPGSTFRFELEFTNLTAFDLSALVWLLTPAELAPRRNGKPEVAEGYYRLGRGKPFGLGSVRLAANLQVSRLSTTAQLSDAYTSLSGCHGTAGVPVPAGVVGTFVKNLPTAFDGTPFDEIPVIAAFRRAAGGYGDGHPVSYPAPRGLVPAVPGPIVTWFQRNEKIANPGGQPRLSAGGGHTLPPLYGQAPGPLPEL